jgi:hypothetical protein
VPFLHLTVWHGCLKWGQFKWDCFHTCAKGGQFSWWEVCYGFVRNCRRIDRPRSCRKMDSSLCPFMCRTLLITFRPLKVFKIIIDHFYFAFWILYIFIKVVQKISNWIMERCLCMYIHSYGDIISRNDNIWSSGFDITKKYVSQYQINIKGKFKPK